MTGKLTGVHFKPWRTDSAGDRVRNADSRGLVAWVRYSHWHISSTNHSNHADLALRSGRSDSPEAAEADLDQYLLSEGAVLLCKDGDDEYLQVMGTIGPEPESRPRPVWLLGEEPDWAALADCWWGGVDAESYEHAAIEDAISELVAEMYAEHIGGELVVEAHRMAVLADDEPELRPENIAEAVIEALDEEYGWEDGPEHNGGTTAIQAAARVFCAAVRKHYEPTRVGHAVATVRVDLRKWVIEEDHGLAAELGFVDE